MHTKQAQHFDPSPKSLFRYSLAASWFFITIVVPMKLVVIIGISFCKELAHLNNYIGNFA